VEVNWRKKHSLLSQWLHILHQTAFLNLETMLYLRSWYANVVACLVVLVRKTSVDYVTQFARDEKDLHFVLGVVDF